MVEKLAALVMDYCEAKNIDLWPYVEGLRSGGPLTDGMVETLIRYHSEWLRG